MLRYYLRRGNMEYEKYKSKDIGGNDMSSKKKELARQEALRKAIKNAKHINNDVDLKTAIGQKSLVIISSDSTLYQQLLQKFSKQKMAAKGKGWGKALAVTGVAITVLSSGILSSIGVPLIGAGAALGVTGMVLEDYKDYDLFMDYDNKQVIFVKVRGTPSLDLPKDVSLSC